jgi:hypothetical protein
MNNLFTGKKIKNSRETIFKKPEEITGIFISIQKARRNQTLTQEA